jgi:hypothetical protein
VTVVNIATYTVQDVEANANSAPTDGATVREVLKNASLPTWTPVVNSNHTITGGDVYLVDIEDYTGNVLVTLFVTNPDELAIDYTYLNQVINVYALCDITTDTQCAAAAPYAALTDNGVWGQSTDAAGNNVSTEVDYLSLSSGYVTFILKGGYEYAFTVDGGVGYTIAGTTTCTPGNGCLSPDYFLTLDPA